MALNFNTADVINTLLAEDTVSVLKIDLLLGDSAEELTSWCIDPGRYWPALSQHLRKNKY